MQAADTESITDTFEGLWHAVMEGTGSELQQYIQATHPSVQELTEQLAGAVDSLEKFHILREAGADLAAALKQSGEDSLLRKIIINEQSELFSLVLKEQPAAVYDQIMQYSYYLVDKNAVQILASLATDPHAPKALKRHFRDAFTEVVRTGFEKKDEKSLGKTIPNPEKGAADGERDRYASYAHVVSMARAICENPEEALNIPPQIKEQLVMGLVNKTPGDWEAISQQLQDFSYQDAQNVADMFKEVTRYFVIPAFLAHLPNDKWKNQLDVGALNSLVSYATPLVMQQLLPSQSLTSVLELSRIWHERQHAIVNAIRDDKFPMPGAWHNLMDPSTVKITGDEKLKGWTVSNLTSPLELQNEGKHVQGKMGTCISGFADQCLNGNQHVFLFRDKHGASQAYIRVSVDSHANNKSILLPNGQYLNVLYHTGPRNQPPSGIAESAYKWFKKEVQAGRIPISTEKQGSLDKDQEGVKGLHLIGYDPLQPGKLQAVFDILCAKEGNPLGQVLRSGERHLIPGAFRRLGVGDFLKKPYNISIPNQHASREAYPCGHEFHEKTQTIAEAIQQTVSRDGQYRRNYLAQQLGLKEDDKLEFMQAARGTPGS